MAHQSLWLIGTGGMATAYAKVLDALGCPFSAIGRGPDSAARFRQETGHDVIEGGLVQALAQHAAPRAAILATDVASLPDLTEMLISAGVSAVLVEKPAGLTSAQVGRTAEKADAARARVAVAYNRRFFSSVLTLRNLLAEDGGLLSIGFDFTEIPEKVNRPGRPEIVKNRWILANSTHVIDLAFFLAGTPTDWHAVQCQALDWHPSGAVFAGSGLTDRDVAFSYTANWHGPGRWGLELVSPRRRFILRPMEQLSVVTSALAAPEAIALDLELDTRFKPGLYRQVEAFLSGGSSDLCSIAEQSAKMAIYERIGGYRQGPEKEAA